MVNLTDKNLIAHNSIKKPNHQAWLHLGPIHISAKHVKINLNKKGNVFVQNIPKISWYSTLLNEKKEEFDPLVDYVHLSIYGLYVAILEKRAALR